MSLLWAVPVVAAAVAVALVLARARSLEDACRDLVVSTRRTAELRGPLAGLRRELRRSGPLVDRVWSHWDEGDRGSDGSDRGDANGRDAASRSENPGGPRH